MHSKQHLSHIHKKLDSRGNAAIEFALILPLLLIMFFGMLMVVNHIMVNRKLDVAANDIAAIISREGRIANYLLPNAVTGKNEFTGGRQYIESLVTTITPVLTFPLRPQLYDYDVKMIGKPLWPKIANPISPNSLRLMWQQKKIGSTYVFNFGYTIAGPLVTVTGGGLDSTQPVASITDDGQSQIIVGIAAPYNQTGNKYLSFFGNVEKYAQSFLNMVGVSSFVKIAAYPVRVFSAQNAANYNIPYNDLNICTDCNLNSSTMSTGGAVDRQACTASYDAFGFERNVSGCVFD